MPLMLPVVVLAFGATACNTGSHVSAQQKQSVAGILQPPSVGTRRALETTRPTTSTIPSATTTGQSPGTTPVTGPPPDVVGENLLTAENALHAVGYSTAAHPWAAKCSTTQLVMQQVPPQYGTVQLFYCVTPSAS